MVFKKYNQSGQSLLIVVLVMIIALTVGLALISRTITSIKTSTEEAESQKALGAAEAGIEQSIKLSSPLPITPFGDPGSKTNYQTQVSPIGGTQFLVNGGNIVARDDDVDIWMSDYSTDQSKIYLNPVTSTVTISFGSSSDACQNPAIEIDVISRSRTTPIQTSKVYDPCPSRRTTNNFSTPQSPGQAVSGITFSYETDPISITDGLFIRVVPIYKDTKLAVTSTSSLPAQGAIITSEGTSGSTKRSISVYQGFPKIPAEFFPYALFVP